MAGRTRIVCPVLLVAALLRAAGAPEITALPRKMLDRESLALYQGTTLVVPPPRQKHWALAPAVLGRKNSQGLKALLTRLSFRHD